MNYKNIYYPESKFGGFTDVDGTVTFYNRVNALIEPGFIVADIGCGRGDYSQDKVSLRRNLRILKGKCKRVIGIDVDNNAADNPYLDQFCLYKGKDWPLEDNSIDLCFCDSVLEHVADPEMFFSESSRIIKSGGYLCIRTPNILSYFGLAARLIPNRFHAGVLKSVQEKRHQEDVFPTLYRCNTKRKIRQMLAKNGFDGCVYGHEAEPAYANFSKILYYLTVLYQRFIPNSLKSTLFIFAKKNL